jgi:survival-of-motor-neuron-related-splicing factor 30
MNAQELETYQVQLSQVELALQADPDNEELTSLRSELKELIQLTEASLAQPEQSVVKRKAAPTPTHAFSAGDEVLAKYSGDGNFYPARVTSVGGSTEKRVYSVVFKGYNNTELVEASAVKTLPTNYAQHIPAPSAKRKLTKEEEDEREKKKKKNEKKLEVRAAKAKEQNQKQASWQKFTKKAERKGVTIAGVAGTSIFKTPDNPLGKGWLTDLAPTQSNPGLSWCNRVWKGYDRLCCTDKTCLFGGGGG